MSAVKNQQKPPQGLSRLIFRAPIHLFNNGLGWLLGNRFLLLNHTGRKSGLQRQAVVEIMGTDRQHHHYLVAAGFGPKTQWYRNLLVNPTVSVQIGQRRWAATAVPLSPTAAGEALWSYFQQYPYIARGLSRMVGIEVGGNEADIRGLGEDGFMPIIRLEPTGAPEMLSLLPGTAWLAGIVAVVGYLILRRFKTIGAVGLVAEWF